MDYISTFKAETQLINDYGEGNAYLIWVMGLYLDYSNLNELGEECLTDQSDDKKIDFLRIDEERQKIYVVQGYYSGKEKDNAPANKASDMNTAAAWLTTGDIDKLPLRLKDIVKTAREAIAAGEITNLELIYAHNCSESVPVEQELKTAKEYFQKAIGDTVSVTYKEIGNQTTARLFKEQNSNIKVLDVISCPFKPGYEEKNGTWNSVVLTVSGDWLRTIYFKYQEDLFSANYRGFLGLTKKTINTGIKNTAEKNPENFWAYNNGITILTNKLEIKKDGLLNLHGISIINGAQTTGSIGSLDFKIDLRGVQILTRIIECGNPDVVNEIVKYNNTQNKITSWDKFGNDPNQQDIEKKFASYHHVYSSKRGFENRNSQLSIENCIQPLVSFLGYYKESNKSKVSLFNSPKLYKAAFEHTKARHILFVSCLEKCLVEVRKEVRTVVRTGTGATEQDKKINDFFESLNSKQFSIAIFGELITKLFVDLNDKSQISFTPEFSDGEKYSINALVVEIKPFVKSALGIIAGYSKDGKSLLELYREDGIAGQVAEHTSLMLNMFYNYTPESAEYKNRFKNMLCNG